MADLSKLKKKTPAKHKTKNAKAESIDLNDVSDLMSLPPVPEKLKDLNFKVNASFHKEFKKYAIMNDMSMKDLLEVAFRYYTDRNIYK